jgi:hypothetical protein
MKQMQHTRRDKRLGRPADQLSNPWRIMSSVACLYFGTSDSLGAMEEPIKGG